MINRTTRLLWRRRYKHSRRQVEDIGEQAEEQIERHFFRRLSRLNTVRRFVISWLALLVLLSGIVIAQTRALPSYYQDFRPVSGGSYTEGIIGSFTNANPLYAVGGVDKAVSQLLFGSLLKFDERNALVGDLAESWSVDESGRRYTVILRDNIFWHDGQLLTAADVLFTYQLIQNPDAKSPLFSSWRGVTIGSPNARTVVFTLPNVLTSFPHSLTNGLVPKHLLENVQISQLRSARFNTVEPVGSGPFKWDAVEVRGTTPEEREERVALIPNDKYYAGAPKLQRFIVRTFRDDQRLLKSFENRELNAMVGLSSVPDFIDDNEDVKVHSIPVTGAVMVFFKNSHDQLNDVKVRRALVRAINTTELVNGLGYSAIAVDSPFLSAHTGYDSRLVQLEINVEEANRLLDEAGWLRGTDGMRAKEGKPLHFILQAQSSSEFTYVTQFLQKSWRAVGVDVKIEQPNEDDFQTVVRDRNYDALLNGIGLGADPDVYAYWHSSQGAIQATNRLNFSEYNSMAADQALESGRTRNDPGLRTVKYKPFLEAWRNDAPALALYQPRLLYVVRGGLYNFDPQMINSASDRLSNVHNWMIRQARVNKE